MVNNGGAIYIDACPGVTFVSCLITNNLGYQNGGAIYVSGSSSSVSFTNCAVRQNSFANSGGGGKKGGGLRIDSGSVSMDGCIIAQNRMLPSGKTYGAGAGAYVDGSLILRNCLIYGNDANWSSGPASVMASYGDGLYLNSGSMTLENCTIAHNLGEGIHRAGGTVSVNNSIIWGNFAGDVVGAASLTCCNIQDGTGAGLNGCFSSDPLFRNGYYLDPASPCVNTGSVTAATAGLDSLTTRTDGAFDSSSSQVDLGYHYLTGFDTSYDDIYVAEDGDDMNNSGMTAESPFASITKALTRVRDGSRIHLAAGTYDLATEFFPLTVTDRIGVQFLGAGADTTILDASGANQRVLSMVNIAGASRLEGLTVRGGNPTDVGGGLYLELCADLTLDACAVVDNSINNKSYGNGILSMDCGLTITNSVVARNFSSSAGGGSKYGAGICVFYGRVLMRDVTLANNRLWPSLNTIGKGGGFYLNGGEASLHNCLIYGNDANSASTGSTGLGDGLYAETATALLTVEYSTLAYNIGEGINLASGSLVVHDSIIWGHADDVLGTATLIDCNIGDGSNSGNNGCFSSDPLFRNGYYLSVDSPCIDVGSVTAVAAGLDGRTTRVDGVHDTDTVDLGYHYLAGTDTTFDDIYVAVDGGSDANAGTAPGESFMSITNALAHARDGSRIHIAAGTYTIATEAFPLSLAGRIGVQLLGAGTDLTIINASGSNNRVLTLSDLAGPIMIDGLSLTGGNPSGDGGGVYMTRCGGLTFSGVSVTNNTCNDYQRGMGFYIDSSVFAITNSVIADNRSSSSGGGHKQGGGIYMLCANGVVTDSLIATNRMTPSNTSSGLGGGIYQNAGTLLLRNVLVYGNDGCDADNATGLGDGINLNRGVMEIESCTVSDNSGQGVRQDGGTVSVENSILWGNGDDLVNVPADKLGYCNIQDGDNIGTNGCISADPLFVNATGGDYHLSVRPVLSPSINAGNPVPEAWMMAGVDLDGNDRILNKRVDMGAFENYVPPFGTVIIIR